MWPRILKNPASAGFFNMDKLILLNFLDQFLLDRHI